MKRVESYESSKSVDVLTVVLLFPSGEEKPFTGICSRGVAKLYVDETMYQNWISESKKEILILLQESFPDIQELRIYADTHK